MMNLAEITAAVELGRTGDRAGARTQLTALWDSIDDRATRCVIAHFLADVQDETEDELAWDLRAMELVSDDQWLPSLHLSLADDYRRLHQPERAAEHLEAARPHLANLPEGEYGDVIRSGFEHVADALAAGSVQRLESNPSS
ncbi:hypothetical protein [Kribbella sp. HUAS MG21]|uniref:Tetratricopeptide repeat protein n=1 Tax=Kribbella sp. HUAS MG21 TaxID=3160966 RepID=A0AAU7T721_9ACTN